MYYLQIERTALHYAMSVDQVESMSTILIGCGAKRIAKDLVKQFNVIAVKLLKTMLS